MGPFRLGTMSHCRAVSQGLRFGAQPRLRQRPPMRSLSAPARPAASTEPCSAPMDKNSESPGRFTIRRENRQSESWAPSNLRMVFMHTRMPSLAVAVAFLFAATASAQEQPTIPLTDIQAAQLLIVNNRLADAKRVLERLLAER